MAFDGSFKSLGPISKIVWIILYPIVAIFVIPFVLYKRIFKGSWK